MMGLGSHSVVLTMVVLILAMKIAGFSVYYRQFKDRYMYTLLKNCMLEQVIFLEEKVWCRQKNPRCSVLQTLISYENVVAINHLPNVIMMLLWVKNHHYEDH